MLATASRCRRQVVQRLFGNVLLNQMPLGRSSRPLLPCASATVPYSRPFAIKITKNTDIDQNAIMRDLNLDVMRMYSQGNLTQASYAADHAIQKAKEMFGPDHIALASAYSNRGFIAKELGEWEDAVDLYKLALEIYDQQSPASSSLSRGKPLASGRTIVLQNLANVLRTMSNLEKDERKRMELRYQAKSMLEDALTAIEEEDGSDSLKYASAVQKLGNVYRDMQNLNEAERLLRKSTSIAEKADPHSRFLFSAKNDLALVLKLAGKGFDEARALYESAIEYYVKRLGKDNKETIVTMHNLAELLHTREDTKNEAQKLRMEILMTQSEHGNLLPNNRR